MKENKCFPKGFNLQETLDFYFQVKRILLIVFNIKFVSLDLQYGGQLWKSFRVWGKSCKWGNVSNNRWEDTRSKGMKKFKLHFLLNLFFITGCAWCPKSDAFVRHVQLFRTVCFQGLIPIFLRMFCMLIKVGLPAKSGVSGSLVLVVPGVMGVRQICGIDLPFLYISPRLACGVRHWTHLATLWEGWLLQKNLPKSSTSIGN